jgi:hypothetical protein
LKADKYPIVPDELLQYPGNQLPLLLGEKINCTSDKVAK